MKVILLDNIKGVGKKDEIINASDGYARNFLFPKKLAVEANNENMSKLKAKKQSEQYKKDVNKENAEKIAKKLDNITFKNTICSATKTRQQAAKELSVDVDCMIVIGGKHSSNTQKLVNICKEQVPTFAIETKEDLDIDKLNKFNLIGVTAGASTPDWIIEDVISFIESL